MTMAKTATLDDFFVGDTVAFRTSEMERNGLKFYSFGTRVEHNITAYGKKWQVQPPINDKIFDKNIVLRNIEEPNVYAVTYPECIARENPIDLRELRRCEGKWETALQIANQLKGQISGKCAYCDQFSDYFNSKAGATQCPLHTVCNACQESLGKTEYIEVTNATEKLLKTIPPLLAAIKSDITMREEEEEYETDRKT